MPTLSTPITALAALALLPAAMACSSSRPEADYEVDHDDHRVVFLEEDVDAERAYAYELDRGANVHVTTDVLGGDRRNVITMTDDDRSLTIEKEGRITITDGMVVSLGAARASTPRGSFVLQRVATAVPTRAEVSRRIWWTRAPGRGTRVTSSRRSNTCTNKQSQSSALFGIEELNYFSALDFSLLLHTKAAV